MKVHMVRPPKQGTSNAWMASAPYSSLHPQIVAGASSDRYNHDLSVRRLQRIHRLATARFRSIRERS